MRDGRCQSGPGTLAHGASASRKGGGSEEAHARGDRRREGGGVAEEKSVPRRRTCDRVARSSRRDGFEGFWARVKEVVTEADACCKVENAVPKTQTEAVQSALTLPYRPERDHVPSEKFSIIPASSRRRKVNWL